MKAKTPRLLLLLVVLALGAFFMKELFKMRSNNPVPAGEKRQYFKSWASYQVPLRPVDPIAFAETEPLTAFYLGDYDENGRLTRFVKYLVERRDLGEHSLSGEPEPGAVLYFATTPGARSEVTLSAAQALPYAATEPLAEYLKAQVNPAGTAAVQHVTRKVFFADQYVYWPNGQLKERVMRKQDGSTTHTRYDEQGKEIQ